MAELEGSMIVERIRLDGRVVVVSGAGGGGIGTATARAMAEAGAAVVGVDLTDDRLAVTAATLADVGLPFTPVTADVTTADGVDTVIAGTLAAHGAVHGLVNVVGGALAANWGPSLEFTREQWHDTITLNLDTAMFMSRAVARQIVRQGSGGSIVCLSSTSGIGGAVPRGVLRGRAGSSRSFARSRSNGRSTAYVSTPSPWHGAYATVGSRQRCVGRAGACRWRGGVSQTRSQRRPCSSSPTSRAT
jgi:NAD(P)-dependent dehydrogenase (short-subunit alcohol dehydrogenase family)